MTGNREFNLELHIDELALHGFGPLDRAELGAAVERALGRLIALRGLPPSLVRGGRTERLDGGCFTVRPGTETDHLADRIARSVYRGFES